MRGLSSLVIGVHLVRVIRGLVLRMRVVMVITCRAAAVAAFLNNIHI
jgi:hypothetical protein